MKLLRTIALALAALVNIGLSQSVTYYVDATGGNDSNDGRTPQTAWQTLAKINARTFFARDSILFKAGSVWTGQLKPKGSGRSGQPIVIDRYGDTTKPCINGGGVTGQGTVYLNNQEYWEINNLEITNDSTVEGDRRGVNVTASNFGIVHHIYLRNLYIHNVKGIVDVSLDAAKRTGGIGIETTLDNTVTRFDDILIEGCTIAYCENTGLYTANLVKGNDDLQSTGWLNRRFTNVRIRNNRIHHISKNAMILRLFDHGVVEYNVCWETALQVTGNTMFTVSCDGTVFQYNEGSFNRATENTPGGGDGSMYDADLRSSNIVFQYSYSHDNSHGLFWNCTVQSDSGIICRYNVSQNDRGIIFCVNYAVTSAYIYNNTVYVGAGLSPVIISERNNGDPGTRTYSFNNNIICNLGTSATYDFRTSGYTRTIDYNIFYGNHPSNEPTDPHKTTGNPLFVSPGSGGTGVGSVLGYALQQNSPAINSGLTIPSNGNLDYMGNPVPSSGQADRGAFEYQGTVPEVRGLPLDGGFEGQTPFSSLPGTTSLTTGGAMQSTTWTIGVSPVGTEAVVDNSAQARTGSKYATFGNIGNTLTKRFQSPTAADSAVKSGSSYVIQCYYRTGVTAPTNLRGAVSPDGTSQSGIFQYVAFSPLVATNGAWQKATCVVTPASSTNSPRYGLAVLQFNGNSTVDIDVDDFAVYEGGSVDVTSPDPPILLTVGNPTTSSLTLSWTAPVTGIDGGGYMVVRGISDPVATPNVNGVYVVGNLPGSGQTVVYVDSSAGCVDTGLVSGAHYYYRVYTVDKAYNYSLAATADGFTSGTIISVGTPVALGWNLISNPVVVLNDSVKSLFPTSSFDYAFAYESPIGYVTSFRMWNGVGYWAKFPDGVTQTITGAPIAVDSIPVVAGWNIIGSISAPVDTAAIVTVPPGIRASNYFSYGTGYTVATSIEPGKAYWVKTNAPGRFVLISPP